MPASAKELDSRLPSDAERASANQLRRVLASHASDEAGQRFHFRNDRSEQVEVILPSALAHLLMELLRHVGSGDAVTVVPLGQMLTTQQAADILNVSRPFLISLLNNGKMPFELVGRHRRIKAEHLFAYKRDRDEQRGTALAELAGMDAEHI